jgi:hypothetical protein
MKVSTLVKTVGPWLPETVAQVNNLQNDGVSHPSRLCASRTLTDSGYLPTANVKKCLWDKLYWYLEDRCLIETLYFGEFRQLPILSERRRSLDKGTLVPIGWGI